MFDTTAKQDATFYTTDMMPFVSLSDLKVEGYEIPNPLLWPGYSWDGLDLQNLTWNQIDAKDLTWDEFESPNLRTWSELDNYNLTFAELDALDNTWDELEGVFNGYAGYWSESVSNRNGDFGVSLFEDLTWDKFDSADLTWDELDSYGARTWDELEAFSLTFDQLDALDKTWDELEQQLTWSDISGSDIPFLDVYFTEDHSSAGLTFKFATLYNEWCSEADVTWYDKDGLFVAFVKVRPDQVLQFAQRKAENYRHIHIDFLKTNKPHSQVKLATVEFGVAQVLAGNDIISASIHEEFSSISAHLPIGTLTCKIQNDESNFYVLNAVGVFSLLQERQTLDVTVNKDGVSFPMGTYYLDSMDNESKSIVTMQAVDLMGIIDKSDFPGGIYSNVQVGVLVNEIMTSAKAEYEIDPNLGALRVSGHIPICTHREALQQVVFAIGATATAARGNKIRIEYPKTYPTEVIPVSKKFYREPVRLNELVTGVDVTSFTYANGVETRELLNDMLEAGVYDIPFPEPINPSSLSLSNGPVLIEHNANRAIISLDRRYDVVLSGIPYVVQTRSHKRETTDLPAATSLNIQYVETASLISPDKGEAIANRIYDYSQKRLSHTFGMINDGQAPGDVIQTQHVDGGQVIGTVEVMDTDLAGGFRSDITLRFAYLIEQTVWEYLNDPVEIYAGEDIGVL